MSQFAREHPHDYEERLDAMLEAADLERKRRRENDLMDYSTKPKETWGSPDDPPTADELEADEHSG